MQQIILTSPFKVILSFLTIVLIIHMLFVEKDILKALLILNVVASYRTMISFLTDWSSEVIVKNNDLNNNAFGFSSLRNYDNKPSVSFYAPAPDHAPAPAPAPSSTFPDSPVSPFNATSTYPSFGSIEKNYNDIMLQYLDKISFSDEDTNMGWWR